ncbi:MAG TPA: phosphoethanolamine transferase, partial [Tissierellaceae bacterium]
MYQENKDNIIKKQQFSWNSKSLYPQKDTVVLILGETTRGDKLGINGYDRNTTPLLSQYDIISYDNTISNAAYTLLSTPIILTRSRGESKSSIYPEKSIISAFKEAGYYTYYITYLNKVHIGDNAINQIVNEVDTYMQSDWDRAKNENLPIDIVGSDIVSEIIKDDHHHKKLIIYKIVGSHYNFHERYTKKYNIFTPSHLDIEYNGPKIEEKEVLHNSYDNTILVTDEAVANILDTLMHVPGRSSLTFISDHGISIFEDNKSAYGGPTPYNYNIPLFFWLKQNNFDERKTSYLKKYQHEKIDSICFLDTFLSVHDIITPYKKGCDLTTNITLPHKRNVILQDKIVDF